MTLGAVSVQTVSAFITLILVALLGAVFLFVRARSAQVAEYAPVQSRAYRHRAVLFWALILVGLPVSVATLSGKPYLAAEATPAPQVVKATAGQWYWDLDIEEVRAGAPVDFLVTSLDVNHGFGLYDATGRLLAQTQAMPGYINHLRYVFEKPGTYRVLCLEYCGLAHHAMRAEITVTE